MNIPAFKARGKGIATESAGVWIRFGFDILTFNNLIAMVFPVNSSYVRVLETLKFDSEKELFEDKQVVKLYSLNKETAADII